MTKRRRRVYSIKNELVKKSQEAALAAIQIFNNPLITFKSEAFIVLMIISWTYLLHAYFRKKGIEYLYSYRRGSSRRRKIDRTKHGAPKYWELEKCLEHTNCPLDNATKNNLLFLIGIRHEIEHQMTNRIDDYISAKFQACCINHNNTLKKFFGDKYGLDKTIPIALQLFSFSEDQIDQIKDKPNIPKNILNFISDFEADINTNNDSAYSYRVIYIRKNVNHEGQADKAIHFIGEDSEESKEIQNVLIKNKQHKKLTQSRIVEIMREGGFPKFRSIDHLNFWKLRWENAAKRNQEAKKYGELVVNNMWLWYEETWLPLVEQHCRDNIVDFE